MPVRESSALAKALAEVGGGVPQIPLAMVWTVLDNFEQGQGHR